MIATSRFVRGSLHRLRGIASVAASGTPPFIPAIPETVQAYGHTWQDVYHWIQSKPREVQRILREEAEHFRHVAHCHDMSSIAAISSQFRAEIQNLLPYQTESVGEVFGGWEFVSEQSREHPMPIYYRRCHLPPSAPREQQVEKKEILLDINKLSELYGENISIGQIKLSKCGNLVACTIAQNGTDDLYSVLVRDVKSGNIYEQPALKGVVSIEWDGDNETLLATQPDELGRPARVVSTSINKNISNVNLKEEGLMNEMFWTTVNRTNNTNAHSTGYTSLHDVFIEDLDVNHNGIVLYQRSRTTGKPEIEILCSGSLRNNSNNDNDSGGGGGKSSGSKESISVVSSYRPQLPDYAWCITPGANADFFSDTLRIMASSPVHPDEAMDLNLKSLENIGQQHPWKKHKIDTDFCVLGHNPDNYTLEKTWAPMLSCSTGSSSQQKDVSGGQKSSHYQKVPISLIYQKLHTSNETKHPKPCLVVVYASYGINLPTDFLLERLPLLKRGWTIALVHARGGGELGRQWHAAGRGPGHKPNSALDVEAAVEYLINNGYTVPGSIALEATSAGAVAAGGVVNSRPELFGAVVLESPFVDVLSTMIDPELPLTVHEYEEFGDPSTEQGMQGLKKVCPYYNIQSGGGGGGGDVEGIKRKERKGHSINSTKFSKGESSGMYPPVLITCSSTDARVPIWGPLKYAAKLRAAGGDVTNSRQGKGGRSVGVGRGSVLVYADAHGGHLADDREKYDLKAVQYAFLVDALMQQQQQREIDCLLSR
ncbi:putative Prolyl endopeptidase-like [Nannochloris sp. 'desiccata']|nr:putative Prolyl endopeptidase-like [Chlorella desiccata (nom. nud.)]